MIALSESDTTLIVVAAIGSSATLCVALINFFGSRAGRSRIEQKVATGNDKNIGVTVHDMAQTVEHISAQSHTNTQELLAIGSKLDHHLAEAAPLNQYVRDQMRGKGKV